MNETTSHLRGPRLTGRHVLLAMLAFFGTVVAVNVTMAMFAAGSWSGLVVPNSYVASQDFNDRLAKADAQAARGWTHALALEEGMLVLSLSEADGTPLRLAEARIVLGRPASEAEDRVLSLEALGNGRYAAPAARGPGQWRAHVRAVTVDGLDWALRYRLTVSEERGK